jgi:hypothetical protein
MDRLGGTKMKEEREERERRREILTGLPIALLAICSSLRDLLPLFIQ